MSTLANFTNTVILLAPVVLWIAGLIPAQMTGKHPKPASKIYSYFAWIAFGCALIAALAFIFDSAHNLTFLSIQLPGNIGAFAIGSYVNSVTVIMMMLVSFVGAIVTRYACNYLDGDPQQGRFHKWLSLTLASILTLIVSGNLLMFSLAWIGTSLCLHQLLMFYSTRPAAVLAAHKKFIASRIGDASLLLAIILIGTTLKTLDFSEIFRAMAAMDGPVPAALQWAGGLIVISAALKSAQFPLHGWLIQVMEAPTPVSALLHAGIVNAGAFLVIRMSPIMSHSPYALGLLAVIGLITLALASLVMLTQTSIKVSLAWSTTAQMGFMLLECGLGLYSLAMLHLVAHSLYKAHAFLASGSGVDGFRAPSIHFTPSRLQVWRTSLAYIVAVLMTWGIATVFGVTLSHQPALLAAGAIVTIALTQLLLHATSLHSGGVYLIRVLGLSFLVCTAYFALHHVFDLGLAGSVLPVRETGGAFQTGLVWLIIAAFIGLFILQQSYKFGRTPLLQKLYVHLYNGLYIDVYITRVLERVWPAPHATAKSYGD